MLNNQKAPRLGVNLDHIATLRQLRGTPYPSLVEAAGMAEAAGASQITIHLREDRRHIQDRDVQDLKRSLSIPMNLEMACTPAMVKVAMKTRPQWVCLVPEKRSEVTTEGGLDLSRGRKKIADSVKPLRSKGIRVSFFIEPSVASVKTAKELGADAVELHTGAYCLATQVNRPKSSAVKLQLERIRKAGLEAKRLGLHVHAGHGFDYVNVRPVSELVDQEGNSLVEEYNIGHAIICRAALVGLERAIHEMISSIQAP